MISTRKILAIYLKQMKNVFYNFFILFVLISTLVLSIVFRNDMAGPETFLFTFISLLMFQSGVNTMSCLVAEEKEKNTLNVLMTSTVTGLDFLISNSLASISFTVITIMALYFILSLNYIIGITTFLLIVIIGAIISTIIGAIIGLLSKSQMVASNVAGGVAFILGFYPYTIVRLQGNFIENIANALEYFFPSQIYYLFSQYAIYGWGNFTYNYFILFSNLIILSIIFLALYKIKRFQV